MANNFLNKVFDFGVSIAEDPNNIKNTGEFVLDTLKGIKSSVEQTAKDFGLISEPIPSNSIVSDRRRPWEKASDEIKDYINVLTNENRIGHQQAVQDLVFDLITAYGGGSAGAKALQMAKPIVSEALNILKNKGLRAFENFMNNKIGQIRYNKVKKITNNNSNEPKNINKVTFKDLMNDPKYRKIKKDYDVITPEEYLNKYVTKQDWEWASAKDIEELLKNKDYVMSNLDEYFRLTGKDYDTITPEEYLRIISKKADDEISLEEYLKLFENENEIDEALNNVVYDKYSKANEQFKNYVRDFIKTNKKDTSKLSKEEQKLWNLVEQNKEELSKLAQNVGVTSKDEIPKLLKFAKQMNEILKNSPANIRAIAKGLSPITLGATGLSVYDLYQAFKEGGDDLLPRVVRDVTGAASTFIPGGALAKIIYGSLGYAGGDKLTREAMRRLGFDNKNPNMQSEYDTGMAYPQLNEFIDEYQTGQSGRRYHVVGDRIYAFDTGQPVNVQQAINDINARLSFEDQQLQDKIKQTENQLLDINQALQQGYNIPQETVQQAVQNYQELQQLTQQRPQQYDLSDYQPNIDLVEQVRQEDNQREQALRDNGQQAFDQQIINMILDPRRYQQQVNPQVTYAKLFNQVAQDTYNALNNFITPTSVLPEYEQYKMAVAQGKAIGMMNEQQFLEATKLRAMQQLAPQIQQTTNTLLRQYQQVHPGVDNETLLKLLDYDLDRRTQIETERNNYAGNILEAYKAQETARHNVTGEAIDQFKAQEQQRSNLATENINAQNAISSRLNAITNQQAEQRQQQLMPYQQANYLGQTIINSAMSDTPMTEVINSNPELFKEVFPGTIQRQQYNQIVLPPANYGRNKNKN